MPVDYAGNTLGTARELNINPTTRTFTDWVGSLDTADYYHFRLSGRSSFNLSLKGLSADADVQVLRLNSNGTTTTVGRSTAGGSSSEAIKINSLAAGTYFARVYQFSGDTNYNLGLSATATIKTDWFGQNLRDSNIIRLARSLARDSQFSRNDMLAIFRNAKDGSAIDANELADLRKIVNNSDRFNMTDPVRYLSAKVAQGTSANMAASQFEFNVVGRWFLGTVAPTARFNNTTLTYTQVQGTLFGSAGQARIGDVELDIIRNISSVGMATQLQMPTLALVVSGVL